jgi:hypothetical protein
MPVEGRWGRPEIERRTGMRKIIKAILTGGVKNSTGAVVRSGDKAGGIWAQATQDATAFGNQAYWYTY